MSAQSKRRTRFQRRLSMEKLDDRLLMSVSPPQAVTVESYNLYAGSGFDLEKALANPSAFLATLSGSPDAQIAARTQQWKDIQATKFHERAEVIAKQIVANRPDLIGLQEVWTYYTGIPDGKATQAANEELDFLEVLQMKLAAQGIPYAVKAELTEHDSEGPAYINGVLRDLRANERLVILARENLETAGVLFTNPLGKKFAAESVFGLSEPGNYGWTSIDVTWGGSKFRFVNMCLDIPIFPVTQALQAVEIVTGPAATTLPVILVGDSNTDGNIYPAYQILVGAGFKDAWVQTHPGDPGYTFGNKPNLKNETALSYFPMRMDLILHRGPFKATSMDRVGVGEKTVSGLWPSDHAGVVARLAVSSPLARSIALPGRFAASLWSDPAALVQVTDTGSRIVPDSPQSRPDPITTPSNQRFDLGGPADKARPKASVVIDRLMADDALVLRPQTDVDLWFEDEGRPYRPRGSRW